MLRDGRGRVKIWREGERRNKGKKKSISDSKKDKQKMRNSESVKKLDGDAAERVCVSVCMCHEEIPVKRKDNKKHPMEKRKRQTFVEKQDYK